MQWSALSSSRHIAVLQECPWPNSSRGSGGATPHQRDQPEQEHLYRHGRIVGKLQGARAGEQVMGQDAANDYAIFDQPETACQVMHPLRDLPLEDVAAIALQTNQFPTLLAEIGHAVRDVVIQSLPILRGPGLAGDIPRRGNS